MRRPALVGLIVGLALLTGCATGAPAGSAPATGPAATEPAAIGASVPFTLKFPAGAGTATLVSAAWTAPDMYAKQGGYLDLAISLTCTSGDVHSNGLLVIARDAAGHTYRDSFMAPEPRLAAGAVPVGGVSAGNVRIDLPPGPVVVSYTEPGGTPVASWHVDGPAA